MIICRPPEELPGLDYNFHEIFLAGSIEQGFAESWQTQAENAIESRKDSNKIRVFNPRREHWDSSWIQSIDNPMFKEQVVWELKALERASTVVMYLDPNTRSPISLLELGLYAQSGKLLVCCPPGFWRKGNVDIVCERYGCALVKSKEELLDCLKHFAIP